MVYNVLIELVFDGYGVVGACVREDNETGVSKQVYLGRHGSWRSRHA